MPEAMTTAQEASHSLISFKLEPMFVLVIPVIFGAALVQMAALNII